MIEIHLLRPLRVTWKNVLEKLGNSMRPPKLKGGDIRIGDQVHKRPRWLGLCHAPNPKEFKAWEIHSKGTCRFFLFGKSNYRRSFFSLLFHRIRIYNHTKISITSQSSITHLRTITKNHVPSHNTWIYYKTLIKLHKVIILSRIRTLTSGLGLASQRLTNLKWPTSNRIN